MLGIFLAVSYKRGQGSWWDAPFIKARIDSGSGWMSTPIQMAQSTVEKSPIAQTTFQQETATQPSKTNKQTTEFIWPLKPPKLQPSLRLQRIFSPQFPQGKGHLLPFSAGPHFPPPFHTYPYQPALTFWHKPHGDKRTEQLNSVNKPFLKSTQACEAPLCEALGMERDLSTNSTVPSAIRKAVATPTHSKQPPLHNAKTPQKQLQIQEDSDT